ncbi:DUF167 domain-containing protein [Patescibacteria group bacterium]|nr:MAG: DUF167 domain-containing protein [Patescibacteria group bacterium]
MRQFRVRVTAGAKNDYIERVSEDMFKISVKTKAKKGFANRRVRELIAQHMDVPTKDVLLVRGSDTRSKMIIIYNSIK